MKDKCLRMAPGGAGGEGVRGKGRSAGAGVRWGRFLGGPWVGGQSLLQSRPPWARHLWGGVPCHPGLPPSSLLAGESPWQEQAGEGKAVGPRALPG